MFLNLFYSAEWTRSQNTLCPCWSTGSWYSPSRKGLQNGFRLWLICSGGSVFLQTGSESKLRCQTTPPFPVPRLPTRSFSHSVTTFISQEKAQNFKKSVFPSQWLDACISLLAPAFCGLLGRIANFPKALNGINWKKTACSNGSYDSERYSLCGPFIFSNSVGKIRLCLFWVSGGAGAIV